MGKKVKIGKQRRDKFYQLAKETGYRSRAAFKLVQLNRKYGFLEKAHALVDLCAAPGGWLQVATQYMPIPSLVIGVDLAPIKPIPNVITFQDDITKDSCRQAIKKELKTWDADCVLHDGSPNVGLNWIQDAFSQAQLTLSALKLSCEILRRGGYFVTKIFRSKDYPALIAAFGKLFKKVHVTKPAASRLESAEIYVVCQNYLKPDRLDPALLDPKIVFKDLNLEPEKPRINLLRPEKTKRKAEGYSDGDYTLFHRLKATDYINSDHHLEDLAEANEIVIDDPQIEAHESTTAEVRDCCKDIKVLGRKELRELLSWRKKLRQYFQVLKAKDSAPTETAVAPEMSIENMEDEEEKALEEEVNEAEHEEKSTKKRKRKKEMKEKRKKKQRLDLKMVIPGDQPDNPIDQDLFSLDKIKQQRSKDIESGIESDDESLPDHEEEKDDDVALPKNQLIADFSDDEEPPEEKEKRRVQSWFQKETFANLEDESDEDEEIERMANKYRHSRGIGAEKDAESGVERAEVKPEQKRKRRQRQEDKNENEGKNDACGSTNVFNAGEDATVQFSDDDSNEKPKKEKRSRKSEALNPETLALGEMWMNSEKSRRDLIEFAYNRYMDNDDNLPDWFAEDEKKHRRKQLPVTKEQVEYYKQRMRDINARPIKKVLEAKGRKRKRALKKLEQTRKRAEAVIENADLSEHEKAQEMKRIYKQAKAPKKKEELTYVVTRKGAAGRRVRRPAGVKGRFRLVDPRLKKDNRRLKANSKSQSKGQKNRSKGTRKR